MLTSECFASLEKAWPDAPLAMLLEDEDHKLLLACVADKLIECMAATLCEDPDLDVLAQVGRLAKLSWSIMEARLWTHHLCQL